MGLPKNYLYSKEHEWIKQEEGKVRIGITEHAQSELGDIVFIELPEVGEEIKMDEPFGSAESVKTVSELYAPLSGKVVEVNTELENSPELVNESPYEKAWMIIVEPTNEAELKELLTDDDYDHMINEI
ncbi:glycine cleavage system H protein [Gracilibacillus boraciitolerans JCM 21714]|uniref:Glycine cleavage system H protein n=1 Tax=Gracilibacillus boraciitolerans JCM 21714 TaxID=1298598 RepID=W4VJB1_9BACI|nr:glycine cleavage system protein GcvH [Gracilibacillus boraciitolerans]GAE92854.1 glycine cleavage system H protein [Gracilibacillus boraciitolerans JCM 21714]